MNERNSITPDVMKKIKEWLSTHNALDDPEKYYDIYAYEKERYTNPFVYEVIGKMGWCNGAVLDIGCGDGRYVRGEFKAGIDISELYCKEAKKYLDEVKCITADGLTHAYGADIFHTIVCADTLEHTECWQDVVRQICILRPKHVAITRSNDDKQLAKNDPYISKIIEMQHDKTCTIEAIIAEFEKYEFNLIKLIEFEEINNLLLFERMW